ncbi:lysozyme inhibitor LprI family protein [Rubrivivax gelatinosus]|uniref:Lysozyme inhibitor LprI-like N-terminal domain-containing protein n=1 Tax=Rubrivivax gelatinosus TaxID=28068 RepID=A0ABS1E1R3_RUBGE|nr:lysozyme inhibitor LprI family protein [Rubrivivax gelatinosus]MBK1715370.1 hypothetical protein [Rubrivivax gelatinosus]
MRNAIIAAALSLPMLAVAQRSAKAETTCLGLLGHADARSCLIAEAAKSDWRLEEAERDLRQVVCNWQENESYKRTALAAQKQAHAEFLRARSAQCELQATLAAGGNGANDRRLLCRIELNDRRVAEVRSIAASIR